MHRLERLFSSLVVKMVNGRSRTPWPRLRSWNASRLVCYALCVPLYIQFQIPRLTLLRMVLEGLW